MTSEPVRGGAAPMRITFLLPRLSEYAVGGHAVVYDHASRLARRGHDIRVCHIARLDFRRPADVVRQRRALGGPVPCRVEWHAIDPGVQVVEYPILTPAVYRGSDVVVATAWNTAEAFGLRLGRRHTPPGAYFLQQHETWGGVERVDATWRLPLVHIAISRWLAQLSIELAGVPAYHVPNAIDPERYFVTRQIAGRPAHVTMLYHSAPWKGSAEGIEALVRARRSVPELRATLFGTFPAPPDLPGWITYHERASTALLRDAYNKSAVFVSPSHSEGWPLPPAEAMACGAALLSTDIPGVADYAEDGRSARLVPARQPALMASALVDLLGDEPTRCRIAEAGRRTIVEGFNWDSSVDKLESALQDISAGLRPGAAKAS